MSKGSKRRPSMPGKWEEGWAKIDWSDLKVRKGGQAKGAARHKDKKKAAKNDNYGEKGNQE